MTHQHSAIGRAVAWAVFLLQVVYAAATVLGFLSLKSPQDPIGIKYFNLATLHRVVFHLHP
jgi:hypothetical protein